MAPSTRDTTQSEALAVGLVAGIVASGLLAYAALFVEPAWEFAQAEPRYDAVAKGKLGSVVELDALTQALRASPAHADLGRAALVQMLTAQRIGLDSIRAVGRLSSARRDLRLGLMVAPTDAYAWTRLAVTELWLDHRERSAAALGMALQVAPAEVGLASMQFDLAVILWHQLNAQAKAALERRLTWAQGHPALRRVMGRNNSVAVLQERFAAARADE
jgi:hypothetical protein